MQDEIQPISIKIPISAVVLAAGASRRMGAPKLLLPWGNTVVIGRVVDVLLSSGIENPVVVTGRASGEIRARLAGTSIHWVHNPEFESTEMLSSLQLGIPALPVEAKAFLVVLGDQPQIEVQTVRTVIQRYLDTSHTLIIPSYQKRRGHPWLVARSLWKELLSLPASSNLRLFLNQHSEEIDYVNIDRPSVLMDLDTPEDYTQMRPKE